MRNAAPILLVLLVACGGGGSGLSIHNGTDSTLRIEGLPSDAGLLVDPGTLARIDGYTQSSPLVAIPTTGDADTHTETVDAPPPGGESVWSIGGDACFIEGDFTSYYEAPLDVPARADVVGMLKSGETLYRSAGKVVAGPGQRLPARHKGGAIRALMQVPCDATTSPEIARAWIEMLLPEIEPR